MKLTSFSLCAHIVILAFVVRTSDGIDCFNCQKPIPKSGEDPCREATMETCPPASSLCLSAKFTVSAKPLVDDEETISALTCFPDMNGHECEFFLKKVQQTTPPLFKVRYQGECQVCSTDGCNSAREKEISAFLFVGVFLAHLYKI